MKGKNSICIIFNQIRAPNSSIWYQISTKCALNYDISKTWIRQCGSASLTSVARLGVFPLDLENFWSFSGKFRGRNSLVGKFSGFFLFRVFFRGLSYFILKSLISFNHRNCLIWNKPSDWLYFLGEY